MAEAEPVIIDDGGSTRIKQLVANQNMDGLLDVRPVPVGGVLLGTSSAQAHNQFENPPGSFRCRLQVRFHRGNGAHNLDQGDLGPGNTVVIESQNQQKLTLSFDAANRLNLEIQSPAAGVDPIVEAKQQNGNRRYIVTNAGAIQRVTITGPAVAGFPAFPVAFDLGATPSIYTMVHLTPRP